MAKSVPIPKFVLPYTIASLLGAITSHSNDWWRIGSLVVGLVCALMILSAKYLRVLQWRPELESLSRLTVLIAAVPPIVIFIGGKASGIAMSMVVLVALGAWIIVVHGLSSVGIGNESVADQPGQGQEIQGYRWLAGMLLRVLTLSLGLHFVVILISFSRFGTFHWTHYAVVCWFVLDVLILVVALTILSLAAGRNAG